MCSAPWPSTKTSSSICHRRYPLAHNLLVASSLSSSWVKAHDYQRLRGRGFSSGRRPWLQCVVRLDRPEYHRGLVRPSRWWLVVVLRRFKEYLDLSGGHGRWLLPPWLVMGTLWWALLLCDGCWWWAAELDPVQFRHCCAADLCELEAIQLATS